MKRTLLGQRILSSSVIARHGDRSPSINLTSNANEQHRWSERLPNSLELQEIQLKFPVYFEKSVSDVSKDHELHPFGALTAKGANQMESLGHIIRRRVQRNLCRQIKSTEIMAFASNYYRTQQSCQYLLKGMLSHDQDSSLVIVVPHQHFLNPFDIPQSDIHKNENIWDRCTLLTLTDVMTEAENRMQHIKHVLCEHLPGFGAVDGNISQDVNSRFKWIKAADYFYCSLSHEDPVPHALTHQEMPLKVQRHSAWRFHHWYSDEEILRLVSKPFLSQVAMSFVRELETRQHTEEDVTSCRVYLSHDVVLLAVHKALECAMESYSATPASENTSDWWPAYASGILFELDEVHNGEQGSNNFEYFIKVSATPRHQSPPFYDEFNPTNEPAEEIFAEFARFPIDFFFKEFA